ncbi:MAG: polysaccharide biosynthesis protein [Acidobacteriaceae bacterium]
MKNEFCAPWLPSSAPDWASLLGRAVRDEHPVRIPGIGGASVLVTGAAGFLGAEIARVLAASGAAKIVLLDICEQHLFEISSDMARRGYGSRCLATLGSVCDRVLLDSVFAEHRSEIVVHAAALKHVPLMESNPIAAVATNALGTWKVAQAAEQHGARQMLLVSTDKAAAPCSIMGAGKRIAELVMLAPSRTRRAALRLVNVIGSPGSVGPLFLEQMARGGPVTVTHPGARRWFFTSTETVRMMGEAIAEQVRGLLLPDPGEPMRIAELARRMVAASGRDVPIVYTELRPGEKVDEVLLGPDEQLDGSASDLLRQVTSPARDHFESRLAALETAVARREGAEMLRLVGELVPGYKPGAVVRAAIQQHAEAAAPLP